MDGLCKNYIPLTSLGDNKLDPDQAGCFFRPDLDPNFLTLGLY